MDYYSVPRRILRGARQLVYPRRCPFCDRVLGSVPVCPDCAAELEKLRRKPGMRLDSSQHYLGELTGAAAPFRYEGCVRRGILHTKYHAAPWAAVELGLWLAKLAFGSEMHMAGAEPVPELVEGMSLGYDCIVPVPASGRARGYNVPQLMAVPLARALGIPLYPKALGRTRAKRHQAGLPFEQRLANVAGAFRVARPEAVEGKRILLVDDVLTTGKSEIQAKIKEMIMAQLEQQEIGLMLTNITMQDSEPPTTEVMEAFKKVETAKQGKETTLNNAEKYRSEKLPEAEAEADQIIKNAEAAKQTRINEAEGQVARFNAMYEEYRKNPEITKERMYYEAMETVLPDVKLVIDSGDGVEKVLPLEKFSGGETVTADTENNNGGE